LHMASPHGINPLVINLDPEGGGPNLQAGSRSECLRQRCRCHSQEIPAIRTQSRRTNVRDSESML
jgi:hypothetical protein